MKAKSKLNDMHSVKIHLNGKRNPLTVHRCRLGMINADVVIIPEIGNTVFNIVEEINSGNSCSRYKDIPALEYKIAPDLSYVQILMPLYMDRPLRSTWIESHIVKTNVK
jgi:hypothetical protein